MFAVAEAAIDAGVENLVVASSAEVYQTPKKIPTTEEVELCLPNSTNPRYSYGGSKIASELIAMNIGKDHFKKVQVFRPHNVYGPDMGWKHVIPQFIDRIQNEIQRTGKKCCRA
jgi:UDP-glucose 4-epimerase